MKDFQQVFTNQLQQAEYKHPTSDGDELSAAYLSPSDRGKALLPRLT